jgi:hypothetical protein
VLLESVRAESGEDHRFKSGRAHLFFLRKSITILFLNYYF